MLSPLLRLGLRLSAVQSEVQGPISLSIEGSSPARGPGVAEGVLLAIGPLQLLGGVSAHNISRLHYLGGLQHASAENQIPERLFFDSFASN